MGVVKRNKDGVVALEHAMQGVQTSNAHKMVTATRKRGLIGSRSANEVDVCDDTPGGGEVIVRIGRVASGRRR
jgi:hypothetical protein